MSDPCDLCETLEATEQQEVENDETGEIIDADLCGPCVKKLRDYTRGKDVDFSDELRLPREDDGLRADGSGQRALFPPTDPGKQPTPAAVYVVVANSADDPHPHVEAVYDNEAAAETHKRAIRDSIKPSSPVAWGAREVEVQEEVSDLDY